MDRRSFFRVAVLGGAAGAAIETCPEWLEDLLKPQKTYFLPSPLASPDDRVFAALMAMYYVHDSPRTGFGFTNIRVPEPLSLDGLSIHSNQSLDQVAPWMGISRQRP